MRVAAVLLLCLLGVAPAFASSPRRFSASQKHFPASRPQKKFSPAAFPPKANALPGIRATLHQSLLDEVNALVPQGVSFLLHNVTIPAFTTKFHTEIGTITLWIWNVKVIAVSIKEGTETRWVAGGVDEAVSGVSIALQGEFRWKHTSGIIHYSDHGLVDIQVDNTDLGIPLLVGEKNHRPTVATKGTVSFHVQDVKITFHGKLDWIYNDLIDHFKPKIMSDLNDKVPQQITQAIDVKAEQMLAKLQVDVPFKEALIDLELLAPPTFQPSKYASFELKGEFEVRDDPKPCPLTPAALPVTVSDDQFEAFAGYTIVISPIYLSQLG
jgi:LBP / BPI / CETP family, N-terminal domain